MPARYYLSETYLATLERHRARHEAAGNGFGYVVRGLDEVAGAIVCGGMGRERNLIVDAREHSMTPTTNVKGPLNDRDIRKMTPRGGRACRALPTRSGCPCRHAPVQAAGQLRDGSCDPRHRRAGARRAAGSAIAASTRVGRRGRLPRRRDLQRRVARRRAAFVRAKVCARFARRSFGYVSGLRIVWRRIGLRLQRENDDV